jgi:aryl-alcohol dehydrogenase-like predicted oxidoreductase
MGYWAIGGHLWQDGIPLGWGNVEDTESIPAPQHALNLGVNFFDTADVCGAGHSERILRKAFAGLRHDVMIITKFNSTFDEISPLFGLKNSKSTIK